MSSTAVVIGALRVNWLYIPRKLLHFAFSITQFSSSHSALIHLLLCGSVCGVGAGERRLAIGCYFRFENILLKARNRYIVWSVYLYRCSLVVEGGAD